MRKLLKEITAYAPGPIIALVVMSAAVVLSAAPQAPIAPVNLRIIPASFGSTSVVASGGSPQSTLINTAFPLQLRALVRDASSAPVSGVTVTFNAPTVGASARFGSVFTATAATDASGVAVSPVLTANGTGGTYSVTATASGITATFTLTNLTSTSGSGWVNVTPAGFNSNPNYPRTSDNFGFQQVLVDPARPSDLYTFTNYQGVWKSTNYGLTWTMVSTGSNSNYILGGRNWAAAIDTNKSRNPSTPPTLYTQAGYSVAGQMGVFKSTDGGVNWTQVWNTIFDTDGTTNITSRVGTDMQGLSINPDNGQHILVTSHGNSVNGQYDNFIFESTNGGATWRNRGNPAGFTHAAVNFVTSTTWIATAEGWGPGSKGTYISTNSGASWTNVGQMGKAHGNTVLHHLGADGTLYLAAMEGMFKASPPYTSFTRIDTSAVQSVIGTPSYLYASYGWASIGAVAPNLRRAPSNGTPWSTTYTSTPSAMTNGAMGAAVTYDANSGKYVIVTGNWLGGLWRYVE